MAIHVYLIHDSRLLAEALAAAFESRSEVCLVGSSASFAGACRDLAKDSAEIALIDVHVGEQVALDMICELRRTFPKLTVLPVGIAAEDGVLRFLEAGANGYLLRTGSLAELIETVQAVCRGEPPCSARVATSVCSRVAELAQARIRRRNLDLVALTPRETEVLDLLAEGLRNKEIAGCLTISLATVKNHVHRILEKLQATSRRQAILRAYENGLVESPLPAPGRQPMAL